MSYKIKTDCSTFRAIAINHQAWGTRTGIYTREDNEGVTSHIRLRIYRRVLSSDWDNSNKAVAHTSFVKLDKHGMRYNADAIIDVGLQQNEIRALRDYLTSMLKDEG